MARNGYNEGCLAAHALDLIGDRWAILVLRELMLGPKRFGTLKAGLPGIATNVLSQRLTDLEGAGLLQRRTLPPPAGFAVYALTEAGLDARGVIDALCRWGVAQPGHDPRKFISPTGLMLSMAVMARPSTLHRTADFVIGSENFATSLGPDGFTARPCPEPATALRFTGTGNTLAAAAYGPLPLSAHVAAGAVQVAGDPDRAQAFLDHFSLRRAAPPLAAQSAGC